MEAGTAAPVTISDGQGSAVVVPRLGAGLARYDRVEPDGTRHALFRTAPDGATHPFDLACNLLLPWSGRISGGGFAFGGAFHPLAPNLPGEPLPIHGNGFDAAWSVLEAHPASVRLGLVSQGPGPYDYAAEVAYALEGGALTLSLAVTHRGPAPLPYGLGLHPWFPRTPGTLLHAPATRVTLEDSRHLPAGQLPVSARRDWDFNAPRRLPGAWINNDFSPWPGRATILWPDRGLALDIDATASPQLSTYILYSPASDADFFCFEPVTHPVDAHNRLGGQAANGLAVLEPGARLAVTCRFASRRLTD